MADPNNYHKQEKEKSKTQDNEIRVTSKGLIRNYVRYAESILEQEDHRSL